MVDMRHVCESVLCTHSCTESVCTCGAGVKYGCSGWLESKMKYRLFPRSPDNPDSLSPLPMEYWTPVHCSFNWGVAIGQSGRGDGSVGHRLHVCGKTLSSSAKINLQGRVAPGSYQDGDRLHSIQNTWGDLVPVLLRGHCCSHPL